MARLAIAVIGHVLGARRAHVVLDIIVEDCERALLCIRWSSYPALRERCGGRPPRNPSARPGRYERSSSAALDRAHPPAARSPPLWHRLRRRHRARPCRNRARRPHTRRPVMGAVMLALDVEIVRQQTREVGKVVQRSPADTPTPLSTVTDRVLAFEDEWAARRLTRRPQMSELIRSDSCQSGPCSRTTTFLPCLANT